MTTEPIRRFITSGKFDPDDYSSPEALADDLIATVLGSSYGYDGLREEGGLAEYVANLAHDTGAAILRTCDAVRVLRGAVTSMEARSVLAGTGPNPAAIFERMKSAAAEADTLSRQLTVALTALADEIDAAIAAERTAEFETERSSAIPFDPARYQDGDGQ